MMGQLDAAPSCVSCPLSVVFQIHQAGCSKSSSSKAESSEALNGCNSPLTLLDGRDYLSTGEMLLPPYD